MANATSTNKDSSEQQIQAWHVGDKCLAPISERGKFAEATIHSLKSDEHSITLAGVLFSGSEQKKYFPLTELCKVQDNKKPWKRVIFDDVDLEKPSFPDKAHSGPAVALSLSDAGDCIPYTINRYLRDYQREGVQFMYKHYIESKGCILGDDMGLGKTVQVISFLAAVLHKKGTREDIENNMPEFLLRTMKKQYLSVTPKKMFLIVAPLSVLYNWKDELDTWGYFRVITLHGTKKDTNLSRVKQGKCEIALTTYETLRLCLDELNSITWSAVIVDEAHRIKNPKAQVTQVMKDLKCRVRIGLTGTILQNNMEELWCVLDWALPGCLGSRTQFKQQFSSPVEYGQRHNATKRELATGRKAMQRLVRKMSMFFLRRTKAIISHQLPKKKDRIVYCSLTDFQRAVYQTVLETEDVGLVLRARESCSCGSRRKRKNCCYKMNAYGETVSALYFSYLAILRKVANHAALLQTDSSTSKKQDTLIKRVCSQVFSKFPDFVKQSKDAAFETLSDPMYSGKMKVLQQLLNHFRKNKDKVLLFSFSTKLLDVLERYCMASGLDYRRLDGNTKPEDRFKIVKEFNGAPDVNICLVSTMAGGLGLNFVGANVVVVFDPTWNPANDLQAIDRAYRIGQCRDVKVFRLISLGTVEEIVYLRQVYKQQLHCVVVGSENAKRYFEAVQGSKEHQGELFGVHNLFKLRARGSCLTREILEREGQVEAGFVMAATRLRENIPSNKLELPLDAEGGDLDPLMPRGEVEKETFDFNSDSEEEAKATSKTKSTKSRVNKANTAVNPREQLTLLQCGFSKLLEKAPKSDDEDTDSSSNSLDDIKQFPAVVKSVNKTTTKKRDTSLDLNAEMLTVDFQTHADFQKQNAKQDLSRLRKHNANWELLSDTEEESDSTNSHQDRSVVLNIVRESESGSDESADVILPSKEPVQDKMVVSKKATAYETPTEQSEDSDAETHTAFTTTGNRQEISKESVFPSVSSFFGKTKSNSVTKAQKSKPGTGTDAISDESDDIEISEQPKRRICTSLAFKQMKDKRRGLYRSRSCLGSDSQIIDTFSSSEEDFPTKIVRLGKLNQRQQIQKRTTQIKPPATKHSTDRNVGTEIQHPPTSGQNTSHKKETTFGNEAEVGSLDRILDGVQEVAYFHSNQNVVGSSKAENHMSRRAVRDVFELKQFSQFPANVAVINSQKFEELSDDDISETPNKQRERKEHFKDIHLYVTHPVTQKARRVHHAGPNTYLIGETPRAIRRKQFGEMVSRFKMASAEELAEHIVAAKSEKRQQMLRDFYASKWPEVEELFTVQVPVELPNDFEREEEYRLKSKKKKTRFKGASSVSRVTGGENSWSDTNSKVHFNESEGDSSSRLTQDDASQQLSQTSRELMLSRFTRCKSMKLEDTSISKVTENNLGMESPIKTLLPKTEGKKLGCHTAEKDSIADLLGDTSILSDLFSSRGSSPATSTRMPHSELPTRKAKARTKDFWDILNEQNDESFSKLTDLSVTEKVCERASLTVAKKKEKYDDSLWKKNENFLWRKYDPRDDRGQGT